MDNEFTAYCNMFTGTAKNNEKYSLTKELDAYKQILNIVNEDENTVESAPEEVKVEEKIEVTPEDVDMKFSPELASEFINTINKFTTVCAKIVKVKTVGKELSDDFYDLYAKIKNLADAASKTK